MGKTSDYWFFLMRGELDACEKWLDFVEESKWIKDYDGQWMQDRRNELERMRTKLSYSESKKVETLPKLKGQKELFQLFGIKDTYDFKMALIQGKIEQAENWLKYIESNPYRYLHYFAIWDNWLKECKTRLNNAKSL